MGQALQVERCDFQAAQNNWAHHTAAISTEHLVVRRGQPFALTLHFARPVPAGKWWQLLKGTTLVAQTGRQPSRADGSLVEFPIARLAGQTTGWEAALEARDDVSWTVAVTPPADAPIGHYTLLLGHLLARGGRATQHSLGTFTLLFNPWCRGDSVFLGNEAQRQEYVLNEEGSVFWGLEEAPQQHPWDFGQFAEDFADISLALLDISLLWLPDEAVGDLLRSPLHVCRLVKAMLNGDTPHPVLKGCWAGDYSDGTSPSKWLGSGPILRQWLASRCQPVRYGQCWMFAAVACSVLRSLGIPTRVVSSFASAQDTAGSLYVDEYFDESATMILGNSEASVWPCHTWNECWMARADLDPAYSGWQALDVTPREQQRGPSLCWGGPVPVRAIKEGRLDLPYDVGTFFVATNARCAAWVRQATGEYERAFSRVKFVGNHISTKGVGSERCEDLTHHYKYPEGTPIQRQILAIHIPQTQQQIPLLNSGLAEPGPSPHFPTRSPQEEAAFLEACQTAKMHQATGPPLFLPPLEEAEEPPLVAWIESESFLVLGEDAQVSLRVANLTGEEKHLQVVLGAQPLQYNGKPLAQFWKEKFTVTIPSSHEQLLSAILSYAEYGPALRSSLLLKLTALLRETASSNNASQARQASYLAWHEIQPCPAQLTLQVPERLVQFQPAEATIQLRNCLPEPLRNCTISVSGWGLIYKERHYRPGPVPAGGTLQLCLPFTPTQAGCRRLTARLETPLLQDHWSCSKTTQVTAP